MDAVYLNRELMQCNDREADGGGRELGKSHNELMEGKVGHERRRKDAGDDVPVRRTALEMFSHL